MVGDMNPGVNAPDADHVVVKFALHIKTIPVTGCG